MKQNDHLVAFCVLLALLATAGCSSFDNPLWRSKADYTEVPAEVLHDLALEIEQIVMNGDHGVQVKGRDGVELADPLIKQAIRSRTMRYKLLVPIYEEGYICEKPNGHLYLYDILAKEYRKSRTRREKNRDALIVSNETNDRRRLYMAIIEANNYKARARTAVEEIFYKARISILPDGYKYENMDGELHIKDDAAKSEAATE